jgi:CheY-like chemotaxis protein
MQRPCFIVVDREHASSISTRKLVIETAKFNVLTAYSAREALDILKRFPAVDGMVIDSDTQELSCAEFVRAVKEIAPAIPLISVSAPLVGICPQADYHLETFNPGELLRLLERLRPAAAAEIENRNEQLKSQEIRPGGLANVGSRLRHRVSNSSLRFRVAGNANDRSRSRYTHPVLS